MTSAAHNIAPPQGQHTPEHAFGHALIAKQIITAADLTRAQKIQGKTRKSQGYTLTELLVVLAIMALMTSLAPTLYRNVIPSARFEATLRTLQRDVKDLRRSARASQQQLVLLIADDGGSYILQGLRKERELPEKAHLAFTPLEFSATRTHGDALIFYANGATSGGALILTQGDAQAQLTIHWLTGQIMRK